MNLLFEFQSNVTSLYASLRQGAICASQQRFAIAQGIMGIPRKLVKLVHFGALSIELRLHN
ncbi:MAG TPA: hypothetical protein V6D43_11105 [Candidatus Sericytochromatia bacterium]